MARDDPERLGLLRNAGCVFAEAELEQIRRHLSDAQIDAAIDRRVAGAPLEIAIGFADFAGVTVSVEAGVFVPRPRAEAIIDAAIELQPYAKRVLDLGCGSGALAAALAGRLRNAELHLCDVDPAAIALAQRNLPVATAHAGSWFEPIDPGATFDLIVAYLPHVPSAKIDQIHADYRAVEPERTVDGGPTGLTPLAEVLDGLDQHLAPGGVFVTLLSQTQLDAALALGLNIHRHCGDDVVLTSSLEPGAART